MFSLVSLCFLLVVDTSRSLLPDGCRDDPSLNCWNYDNSQCTGEFETWARMHCPYRCGYCAGSYPPCQDENPDCSSLGSGVCRISNFQAYLRKNCRKFCGFCSVPGHTIPASQEPVTTSSTIVTTQVPECKDVLSNCKDYNHACSGVFETWAHTNCAKTCGYCESALKCADTTDCEHLPNVICTDAQYREFAQTSCRRYCGFCKSPTTSTLSTTSTPSTSTSSENPVTTMNLTSPGTPTAQSSITTSAGTTIPQTTSSSASHGTNTSSTTLENTPTTKSTPTPTPAATTTERIPTPMIGTPSAPPAVDVVGCPSCLNENDPSKCRQNISTCSLTTQNCFLSVASGEITAGCTDNLSKCLKSQISNDMECNTKPIPLSTSRNFTCNFCCKGNINCFNDIFNNFDSSVMQG